MTMTPPISEPNALELARRAACAAALLALAVPVAVACAVLERALGALGGLETKAGRGRRAGRGGGG